MAQGQDVDQRAETKTRGALGDGRQQHARRRRHAKRRRVMLGDMIGVEAAAVVDLGQFEPAFVELSEARTATVDVVEDSEFHLLFPCWKGACRQLTWGRAQPLLASGSWASIRMNAILQKSGERLTQAWLVACWMTMSPALRWTSESSSSMSISPDSTMP